jgi:hypothetical protein
MQNPIARLRRQVQSYSSSTERHAQPLGQPDLLQAALAGSLRPLGSGRSVTLNVSAHSVPTIITRAAIALEAIWFRQDTRMLRTSIPRSSRRKERGLSYAL